MSRGATLTSYPAILLDIYSAGVSTVYGQPGKMAAQAAIWNSHEGALEPFSFLSISPHDRRLEDRLEYGGASQRARGSNCRAASNQSECPIMPADSLMIG
jgi:hypothetical protein